MKKTFSQKQNQKYHSKNQLDEKNLPFHDVFIILLFCISPQHVRRRLHYIIKDDSNEGLQKSSTNEILILYQCNGKIKLITHLCCPFSTYYLDVCCHHYCYNKFVAQSIFRTMPNIYDENFL